MDGIRDLLELQIDQALGRSPADLVVRNARVLNLVTGESGNFLSPNYMDQWKAWYEGLTFVLPFSPEAVERAKAHELLLEPK